MIGTVQQREAELAALYPIWENHTQWTWFLKNCQRFSEQVFLIDGNQEITYGEMMNLVIQASGGLYACGVRPGMMAAVDMTNRKELIASVFALSRLGCTAVMVNPRLSDTEREYILRKSDAAVLITDKSDEPFVPAESDVLQKREVFLQIPFEKGKFGKTERVIGWHQLLILSEKSTVWLSAIGPEAENHTLSDEIRLPEGFCIRERLERYNISRTSMIMFTSGSTSHPKGVMLTDDMLLRSAFATANTRHMEIGRRIYLPIPLFHAMAYVEGMLAAIMVGGSIVISDRKTTLDEHIRRMQQYRVNDIVCISSVMIRLMSSVSGQVMPFPAMHAAYWAGVCPDWVWEAACSFFQITDCGNGYGMTECGSTSHIMCAADSKKKVSHCHGKLKQAGIAAMPEGEGTILSVKIMSEDRKRECRPGEIGEILLKGISVTNGYYKEPEETARLFDQDGWMHSGDLGMVDEEGILTFLGRKDEQFKVNGENVSPEFVGNILMQHENVRYAEVVGIPHERCGEVGVAFVEFYENRKDAVWEIEEYSRRKLARFQQPAGIFSMNAWDWPKTSTGKVIRKTLKEMAAVHLGNGREKD